MSSLEIHLAGSSEDKLLRSLHFDQKSSAAYVQSRQEVSYASSSGGSFSPTTGIRVIRFALNDGGAGFLSGDTVRLAFTLRNEGGAPITPITLSPSSLFRRFRLLAGGVEIEDIAEYGRYHEMRTMMMSAAEKINEMTEGWGGTADASSVDMDHADPIPAGGERRMLCKFHSSFLNQGKKLMLAGLTALTLELELGGASDCFAEDGCNYTIIRPTILASVLQLDPAVVSSYTQHLLSGKSLSYNCPATAFCMKAAVTSSTFSLPISRGFSRLSSVAFSFYTGVGKQNITFNHPLAGAAPTGDNDLLR